MRYALGDVIYDVFQLRDADGARVEPTAEQVAGTSLVWRNGSTFYIISTIEWATIMQRANGNYVVAINTAHADFPGIGTYHFWFHDSGLTDDIDWIGGPYVVAAPATVDADDGAAAALAAFGAATAGGVTAAANAIRGGDSDTLKTLSEQLDRVLGLLGQHKRIDHTWSGGVITQTRIRIYSDAAGLAALDPAKLLLTITGTPTRVAGLLTTFAEVGS